MSALTWDEMILIEPRLMVLKALVKNLAKFEDEEDFCANKFWFGYPDVNNVVGIKSKLVKLVGYQSNIPRLCSTEAYDIAYQYLYQRMPLCNKNCTCA